MVITKKKTEWKYKYTPKYKLNFLLLKIQIHFTVHDKLNIQKHSCTLGMKRNAFYLYIYIYITYLNLTITNNPCKINKPIVVTRHVVFVLSQLNNYFFNVKEMIS
jgi:hypothetical protein